MPAPPEYLSENSPSQDARIETKDFGKRPQHDNIVMGFDIFSAAGVGVIVGRNIFCIGTVEDDNDILRHGSDQFFDLSLLIIVPVGLFGLARKSALSARSGQQ